MKIKLLLISIVILSAFNVFADEEQSTYAYVTTSANGRYFFIMLPHPNKYYMHSAGTGYGMTVTRTGKQKILWKVKGWYAFKTYLSYDGIYLVRIGNWPRGRAPSHDHIAIAFYKRGKLLKKYSTKDLIKDVSEVKPSVSHYSFRKKIIGFIKKYTHYFSLITIDNIRYTFDVRNGKIVSRS